MPFDFSSLQIPEVRLITPKSFVDNRGFFMETYKRSDFVRAGIHEVFVQDNFSASSRNSVRGLHFQRDPSAQGKLVQVTLGRAWDVAVDIRPSSPTFLRWIGHELDDESRKMLYIPPGFAHGFAAISKIVHFQYKCTAEYDAAADGGVRWNDPTIAVAWPIDDPNISEKDSALPTACEVFNL